MVLIVAMAGLWSAEWAASARIMVAGANTAPLYIRIRYVAVKDRVDSASIAFVARSQASENAVSANVLSVEDSHIVARWNCRAIAR